MKLGRETALKEGNNRTVTLEEFISAFQEHLSKVQISESSSPMMFGQAIAKFFENIN